MLNTNRPLEGAVRATSPVHGRGENRGGPGADSRRLRAGIYCRISLDKEGAGLGVARQQADCERLAHERGWEVAEVFSDNDLSAFSRRKPRPAYEALMAALRAGDLDALVVWHLDRLYRQPRELEDLIDLCERKERGVRFAACHGEADLSTVDGRFMARMIVSVANKASGDSSRRVRRKMAEVAQAGRPHGGRRPFGFEEDRVTHRRSEAAIVREAVDRILDGESQRSLVLDLNARGLLGANRRPWEPSTLRRMLLSPRLAGKRQHNGVETDAVWPALVTPDERVRLQAILNDPARRRRGRPGLHLLSGLLRCGECGSRLVTHVAFGANKRSYICPPPPRGCLKVSVTAELVERWVEEAVLAVAGDPVRVTDAPSTAPPDETDPAEAIEEAQARLGGVAAMLAAGEIGLDAYKAAQAALTARIEAEMAVLTRRSEEARSRRLVGPGERLRDIWPELGVDDRRGEISRLLDHLVVRRLAKGHHFRPERLEPVWR